VRLVVGRFGALLVVGLVLASGCGSESVQAGATHEPGAQEARLPARLALSLGDHGRTIRVARFTKITLVLGGRYRWTDPKSGGAVVANEVVSDEITSAQMWELRARRIGLARLTSAGSPACRPAAVGCPQPRRFAITLDVRK
jgi:hypothetical protein